MLARLSRIYLDMLLVKTASEAAHTPSQIAKIMKMKDFRITKLLGSVAKLPITVLENAIRLCYETDRAMKSEASDPWVMLDTLAIRIYAPKSLKTAKELTVPPKL